MGLFDRFKKTSKESLLGYLKNSISDNSSLEHIVSVFEEMCNMPLKEDMILFETGTYSLQENLCLTFLWLDNFLMMRKSIIKFMWMCYIFQRKKIKIFNELYGMRILKKIYSAISKKTPEFSFCKDKVFSKIEIYLDET